MDKQKIADYILCGTTTLGIEMGSTRIKAVLIGPNHQPIASSTHDWENRYEAGFWTYPLAAVWDGLRDCYAKLAAEITDCYGITLTRVGAIGFSGMMHGYLPFDAAGNQLTEFRTWRNTTTEQAANELSELLCFNIPQRWSVAHLWQAVLDGEAHVKNIAYLTTVAGYVHWQLTGKRVLGVGEASGVFPIDHATGNYDATMAAKVNAKLKAHDIPFGLGDILPDVLGAGETAGTLSQVGAKMLDPTGNLQAGIPLCPPEGDAGTGMVATNSVAPRTGNVSAGTSVFAMLVLEKALSKAYPEIDIVTTPTGAPVAMVHCNTCTGDLDAWVGIFAELLNLQGESISKSRLYDMLYKQAMAGDPDCGGLLSYNYYSGEPITKTESGRPLFVRNPDSRFTLANFMRTHLYSAMATLKLGMDILLEQERVSVDCFHGHGGLFKTPVVGQQLMAGALGVPIVVSETAGEGGAWGMALLAAYMQHKVDGQSLEQYLESRVFADISVSSIAPNPADIAGFAKFIERYKAGLAVEKAAISHL